MTFRNVNTGPPRTSFGDSGLGAVGGPRGVGAGALRILVEFLTQYDSERVKQLEADIQRINNLSQLSSARTSKALKAEARDQALLRKIQDLRLTLSRNEAKEILKIRDATRTTGQAQQQRAQNLTKALAQTTGLREDDIKLLVNQDRIEERISRREARRRQAAQRERVRQRQFGREQVVAERQLFRLQQIRTQLVPRLGALALGAVGGIFGGAVIGVGFAAAEAGLKAIGEGLQQLFDPARKAREVLSDVADEIDRIARAEGLEDVDAAAKFLEQFGEAGENIDPAMLAAAVATAKFTERTKELKDVLEIINHQTTLNNEAIRERARVLAREADLIKTAGLEEVVTGRITAAVRALRTGAALPIGLSTAELQVARDIIRDLGLAADESARSVRELALAEDLAASAGERAALAQRRFSNEIQRIAGLRISGLEDQLSALSDAGPSARTQRLTNQLEAMAEAQARNAFQSQLAQLQEQRALLLLEQRIKFQGQSIRLEQLSGRAALVAIDARIEALQRAGQLEQASLDRLNDRIRAARRADEEQDRRDEEVLEQYDKQIEAIEKQGDAQDRLNRLLSLQFRLSQDIRRQEGESIGDFLARRANETRELLAEQADLRREEQVAAIRGERDEIAAIQEVANERREAAIEAMELEAEKLQATIEAAERARAAEIDALNERRAAIELQVQLEENAEQIRQLNAQETARQRQRLLQQELEDSQERDRKETESRRKALEEQIKAEKERLDNILRFTEIENIERLRIAALGAKSYADAQAVIGELVGARRALAELEAWAKANRIPRELANQILDPLRATVNLAQNRVDRILARQFGGGHREFFQHGGIIPLTNASTAFGQNFQFGEAGKEIGVILSNRVARILQDSQRPLGDQTFIIQRSDDPYRDKQRFGRAVEEAVERALR